MEDLISIATIYLDDKNAPILKWLALHVDATYLDNEGLGEHLYSVNCLDDYNPLVPQEVSEFIANTISVAPSVAYFRFVC